VVRGSAKIARLFSDPKQEELNYFRKNGYYPIMHVIAFKDEALDKHPWAARSMMEAFEQAKDVCARYYDDPNWSRLAWARHLVEEERRLFGEDPWPSGVRRNRANLERFAEYSRDQGLIPRALSPEELFHTTTLET
jgi:4,5-dihydroxyphthalate decarboxylase